MSSLLVLALASIIGNEGRSGFACTKLGRRGSCCEEAKALRRNDRESTHGCSQNRKIPTNKDWDYTYDTAPFSCFKNVVLKSQKVKGGDSCITAV